MTTDLTNQVVHVVRRADHQQSELVTPCGLLVMQPTAREVAPSEKERDAQADVHPEEQPRYLDLCEVDRKCRDRDESHRPIADALELLRAGADEARLVRTVRDEKHDPHRNRKDDKDRVRNAA